MKVTMKDIAKMAQVSKSTVSRYLNEGYVSEENRLKIAAAILATNYQANFFAKALKTNKSQLIAIVIPRLDSFSAIQTLKGMNLLLHQAGYQIVIVPKNTIEEDETVYLHKMIQQGFDGIIVMAHHITDTHVQLAKNSTTPIIFTGQTHPDIIYSAIDDAMLGQLLGQYVQNLEGENILYLGVSEDDKAVGLTRKTGFLSHCTKKITVIETGFRMTQSFDSMCQYYPKIHPDIIVGATDNIALGALQYLSENSILVPNKVQVIGVGNYEVGSIIKPALTTISVDYQAFGRISARKMLYLLDKSLDAKEEIIEYKLITRNSTR